MSLQERERATANKYALKYVTDIRGMISTSIHRLKTTHNEKFEREGKKPISFKHTKKSMSIFNMSLTLENKRMKRKINRVEILHSIGYAFRSLNKSAHLFDCAI